MTTLQGRWRGLIAPSAAIGTGLLAATLAVHVLERIVGLPDASATYLVAVVVAAVTGGTAAALATAFLAVLVHNYFFIDPVGTFVVSDPEKWLTLLLLLFVGVVVGRLAARERERAASAAAREQEARAAFRVGWTIAVAPDTRAALPALVELIRAEGPFDRVRVALGSDEAAERVVVDSSTEPFPAPSVWAILQRKPGDQPAEWRLVHAGGRSAARPRAGGAREHRVVIEAAGHRFGTVRALRTGTAGHPDAGATRLVSAAADQIAIGLQRDVLAAAAVDTEVIRRSDSLKSAMLAAVSHDLRTPLAAIRATAGGLADAEIGWTAEEVRTAAAAIDRDATRLARLVTNLLDASRIEAGALRPEPQVFVVADTIEDTLDRLRARLEPRRIELDLAQAESPVFADPMYVDQAVTNVLENVARHARPDAMLRITASRGDGITVTIEDSGPGVPASDLPRLFDRFHGVSADRRPAGATTGLGLAIARGLIEATGGAMAARRSDLGGLAIEIRLPMAIEDLAAEDAAEDAANDDVAADGTGADTGPDRSTEP